MTKSEAETAIRALSHDWAREKGINIGVDHASFYDFKAWIQSKGYSRYLNFRSLSGADYDAEAWFDQEMKQTWRR